MIALLVAGSIAMLASLVGTRLLIGWLVHRSVSQPILARSERGPAHEHKAGTPTMGGLAIIGAALLGYLVAHIRKGVIFTNTGLVTMCAVVGAAFVGFLDDWIKITNARNLGLSKRTKSLGLLIVGIGFAVGQLAFTDIHTTLGFTRFDRPGWQLGAVGWAILAVLVIQATANSVNLTDGLDGLAAGSSIYAFAAYVVVAFYGFRHPTIYELPHALDLSVIAASMLGALTGFLWWNAPPARIFMGDVGSLAIGTALGGLAMATSTPLLLVLVAGLFVAETLSVIIQTISYRSMRKRVFKMTPIHHHFELSGWPETTVLIRFWIIAGIFTAVALGVYYADFLKTGVSE